MTATESRPVRNPEVDHSDYPTPPDLQVPAWTTAATAPHLLAKLKGPTQSLSATADQPTSDGANTDLFRRAVWAPDGSALLAITESQQKHVLHCVTGHIERAALLKSPSPLLDAVWYPIPAADQPHSATWCFAVSHRDLPIRLTASTDGTTRASYSIMNHVEKYIGPHSLAFSPDLSRLYCGLWSSLAVFPLSTPGLNAHSLIPLTLGKRSSGGQRGIVSALATSHHPSGTTNELVAVGTFSGTVGIYSFDPAAFPGPTEHTANNTEEAEGLAQNSCLAGWREVEGDGVTQLKFHPCAPWVLFVASRRSDYIYVYDVRYLMGDTARWAFRPLAQAAAGVRSAHLLAKLRRPGGRSHQRLYFDVDWAGRWLASGDEEGMIHLWRIDTGRFTDQGEPDTEFKGDAEVFELELMPDLSWKAHEDAVGSVSFHPYEPWLASVSGSRHWPDSLSAGDSDSEESNDSTSSSASGSKDSPIRRKGWSTLDSSLKIWDFSRPPTNPI